MRNFGEKIYLKKEGDNMPNLNYINIFLPMPVM